MNESDRFPWPEQTLGNRSEPKRRRGQGLGPDRRRRHWPPRRPIGATDDEEWRFLIDSADGTWRDVEPLSGLTSMMKHRVHQLAKRILRQVDVIKSSIHDLSFFSLITFFRVDPIKCHVFQSISKILVFLFYIHVLIFLIFLSVELMVNSVFRPMTYP